MLHERWHKCYEIPSSIPGLVCILSQLSSTLQWQFLGAHCKSKSQLFIIQCPTPDSSVTAVGATTNINPEVAVSRFFSGGGFSNYVSMYLVYDNICSRCHQFARPAYQEKTVKEYLGALPKGIYEGLFNSYVPSVLGPWRPYQVYMSKKNSTGRVSSRRILGIFDQAWTHGMCRHILMSQRKVIISASSLVAKLLRLVGHRLQLPPLQASYLYSTTPDSEPGESLWDSWIHCCTQKDLRAWTTLLLAIILDAAPRDSM